MYVWDDDDDDDGDDDEDEDEDGGCLVSLRRRSQPGDLFAYVPTGRGGVGERKEWGRDRPVTEIEKKWKRKERINRDEKEKERKNPLL